MLFGFAAAPPIGVLSLRLAISIFFIIFCAPNFVGVQQHVAVYQAPVVQPLTVLADDEQGLTKLDWLAVFHQYGLDDTTMVRVDFIK